MKLCDFGFARKKSHTSVTWAEATGGGTFPYMAPEIHIGVPGRGKMMGQPCSDVWSMCVAMVEWFTGKHPWIYDGPDSPKKQVKQKKHANSMPDLLVRVPQAARNLLLQGLEYDYAKRSTAANLKEDFGMCFKGKCNGF